MSISINKERCQRCRACVEVCPGNLIKCDAEGYAYIKDVRDCWGCTSCLKACHAGAIEFFLGADIGGQGSRLTYENKGDLAYWHVMKQDGTEKTVVINRRESNKY